MSSIKLAPNASGTGEFTIAAPNSNTNRTFNLPDSSGTIATAESTLSQFNASGSAPVYAARAWVNFNGTGTVAIRASGNVSSITDNGTGDYTVNFTTAMSDANYCVVSMGGTMTPTTGNGNLLGIYAGGAYSTTAVRLSQKTLNSPTSAGDIDPCLVAIFR